MKFFLEIEKDLEISLKVISAQIIDFFPYNKQFNQTKYTTNTQHTQLK